MQTFASLAPSLLLALNINS